MSTLRCAILFGIPTTRDEYWAAAEGIYCQDYASMELRLTPANAQWLWDTRYGRVCESAQSLEAFAGEIGARIFPRATVSDLSAATSESQTVIVFAHWRGDGVRRADIRGDVRTLDEFLRSSQHKAAPLVANWISESLARHPDRRSIDDAVLLEDAMNTLVGSGKLLQRMSPEIAARNEPESAFARALSRDVLDAVMGHYLRPGNRLELFDGLHRPHVVLTHVSRGFTGSLDLTSCSSTVLGTFLDRTQTSDFITIKSSAPVDPEMEFRIVRLALQHQMTANCPYWKARIDVEQALRNHHG